MKTTIINSTKGNEKLNVPAVNPKTEQPKTNGLPLSKEIDKKETESKEAGTPAKANPQIEKPKKEDENPQTEPQKPTDEKEGTKNESIQKDAKAESKEKPVMNLESTLKLVEELHRRKMQRDRLMGTIDTLETFEIAQQEDAEETDSNHFQGCMLTIEDDERRKFTTKNSVIIQAVAQFVNRMCVDRLAEIEAGIIIPA